MNAPITPNRPSVTQLIPTAAALVISYPLLQRFGDLQVAGLPLQRLRGPIMLLLGAVLVGQLLSLLLTGSHLRTINSSLMLMAWALATVPVLADQPSLRRLSSLEQPLLWLIGIYVVYRIARCWAQESETLETALQVTALSTAAFILSRLLPLVWPAGRPVFDLGVGLVIRSPSQAIVFALIMVAALRSASLIQLAENKLLRLLGGLLKDTAPLQFVGYILIFLYSHDLRPVLVRRYDTRLGLMEWGGAAVILALGLDRLRARMKRLPDGMTVDQLARHLQDVSVTSDDELTMVARLMTAFVDYGERSGIATYLIAEAARLGVTVSQVQAMAARLLEHSDTKAPGLTTHWEGKALARRNREQRLLLLQATVRQFRELIRTVG